MQTRNWSIKTTTMSMSKRILLFIYYIFSLKIYAKYVRATFHLTSLLLSHDCIYISFFAFVFRFTLHSFALLKYSLTVREIPEAKSDGKSIKFHTARSPGELNKDTQSFFCFFSHSDS